MGISGQLTNPTRARRERFKVKVTIEIDDGVISDGYETVRFGSPQLGEEFVDESDGAILTCTRKSTVYRLIVRKVWQPPVGVIGTFYPSFGEWWLTDGFVSLSPTGRWQCSKGDALKATSVFRDFTPPMTNRPHRVTESGVEVL